MNRKKLLIIDDEKEVCIFLQDFFEEKDFEVSAAHSGLQAIQQIPLLKPDLILLDVRMPGMDGLQVLEEIKQLKINSKIIMMTGAKEPETIEKAMRLGAHYYLTKPFSLQLLSQQIDQFLSS